MRRFVLTIFMAIIFTCEVFSQNISYVRSDVYFYVGGDSIIKNDEYFEFLNQTLPYLYDNIDKLEKIYITGYTSPEGTMSKNGELAKKRAQKVLSLINLTNINEKTFLYSKPGEIKYFNPDESRKYYNKMRSSVIEMWFKLSDTVFVNKKDTLYVNEVKVVNDTVFVKPKRMPLATIKTNVLLDIMPYSPFGVSFTPNISLEVFTHFWETSLEFEYVFPWWKNDTNKKYWQIINGTIGVRKYFGKYQGWFVGLYGNTGYYDLSINEDKGWQGECYGYGLSLGYVWKIHSLRVEPYIRVGVLNTRYDSYHAGKPFNGKYYYNEYISGERRYKSTYIGPTMFGINVCYDIVNLWKW